LSSAYRIIFLSSFFYRFFVVFHCPLLLFTIFLLFFLFSLSLQKSINTFLFFSTYLMQKSLALIPLRAQPLHLWHVNLFLYCQHHFKKSIILLSGKGWKDNPFVFSQRKKRIEQAIVQYSLRNIRQAKLPSFSSPAQKTKAASDVKRIQKLFYDIAWSNDFCIVSGNQKVCQLCSEIYNFSLFSLQQHDIARMLDEKNPFVWQYENNAASIRHACELSDYLSINKLVPSFVYDDLVDICKKKNGKL